ncbi:glycosyltransferase family 2 protein [Patescibacteria group bacterium]|nr:glycosyltransferase family 2 protein [Patescibacteria group bacterium]
MIKNNSNRVVIIIPAYNEQETIFNVIVKAREMSDYVIVIDDGSKDNTKNIAKQAGAIVYSHFINLGLGATLATGLRAATKYQADIVVTMDADGQHQASDINRLISPIISKQADVVIGSRLIGEDKQQMPISRRAYNYLANFITYLLYLQKTSDSQSGLRAFSADAVRKMEIKSQRMEVSSEFFKEIKKNNLCLKEIPIKPIYTDYSMSKGQSFFTGVKTFLRLILNRLTE